MQWKDVESVLTHPPFSAQKTKETAAIRQELLSILKEVYDATLRGEDSGTTDHPTIRY
jgi:hypothetical protein